MLSDKKGFTLVELMFAVVIIAISVLAVYEMFVQGSKMINEEYHRRLGLERAQAHIELAGSYITLYDSIPRGLSEYIMKNWYPRYLDIMMALTPHILLG